MVDVWAEHPYFVYRADLRHPQDVFTHGFPALGNNNNLHDHVSGTSCQTETRQGNTAFVDTTADEESAQVWGKGLMKKTNVLVRPATNNFYIYKIHATKTFYELESSLKKARDTADPLERILYGFDIVALSTLVKERWFSYGKIEGDLVKEATLYEVNAEAPLKAIKKVPNANYRYRSKEPEDIMSNPEPYIHGVSLPSSLSANPPEKEVTACVFSNVIKERIGDIEIPDFDYLRKRGSYKEEKSSNDN